MQNREELTIERLRIALASEDQSLEYCLKLIDSLADAALNQAMLFQFSNQPCTLQNAFANSSPEICVKLIDRLTEKTLMKALLLEDALRYTPFQVAFIHQPPEVCLWLLNRLTNEFVSKHFLLSSENGANLLQLALRYQSAAVCLRLIDCIKDWKEVVKSLHDAAWYQSEDVFIALVKKIPSSSLTQAIWVSQTEPESMIGVASQYQTAAAFQILLHKLSESATKEMVNVSFRIDTGKFSSDWLRKIALYQPIENFENFLSLLNEENIKYLLTKVKFGLYDIQTRFALRALQFKQKHRSDSQSVPEKPKARESKPADSSIPIQETVDRLLALLHQFDKSESTEEKKPLPMSTTEEQAIKKFSSGVFVKIVRHEDDGEVNAKFVTHLFNPAIRDVVRDSSGITKQGFKLQLNPSAMDEKKEAAATVAYTCPSGYPKMINARTLKERALHKSQKPKATLTTKHPVTYISRQLNTAQFGYHAGRVLVGYGFTVNEKNIKLLSTQDCGTFKRWWYDKNLNALIGLAAHAKKIICSNFAEFVQRVDAQPYVVNEVLVKLSALDLFAIVIGKDIQEARKIAITRRLEIFRTQKIDLPILIYDPEKQTVVAYTRQEQHQQNIALFVDAFKRAIVAEREIAHRGHYFFNKPSPDTMMTIHVDTSTYKLNLTTADSILAAIKYAYAKSPGQAFAFILRTLQPAPEANPKEYKISLSLSQSG